MLFEKKVKYWFQIKSNQIILFDLICPFSLSHIFDLIWFDIRIDSDDFDLIWFGTRVIWMIFIWFDLWSKLIMLIFIWFDLRAKKNNLFWFDLIWEHNKIWSFRYIWFEISNQIIWFDLKFSNKSQIILITWSHRWWK